MRRLINFFLVPIAMVLMSAPVLAYTPLDSACSQADQSSSSAACNISNTQNGSTSNPVNSVLQTAANILATVTGVAAVLLIIISGATYVSSGGNPERAKKARAILFAALIGVVIIALSWSIITFVVERFIK